MTNREKFKDVFGKDIKWSDAIQPQMLALKSAQINGIDCMEEWLNEEYHEPTTKNDLGDEYISRSELMAILSDYYDTTVEYRSMLKEIAALPSVTSQIRPKGHWIGKGYFITCSCCNEMSYPFDYGGYGSIYHDYCPNCGADMREDKE